MNIVISLFILIILSIPLIFYLCIFNAFNFFWTFWVMFWFIYFTILIWYTSNDLEHHLELYFFFILVIIFIYLLYLILKFWVIPLIIAKIVGFSAIQFIYKITLKCMIKEFFSFLKIKLLSFLKNKRSCSVLMMPTPWFGEALKSRNKENRLQVNYKDDDNSFSPPRDWDDGPRLTRRNSFKEFWDIHDRFELREWLLIHGDLQFFRDLFCDGFDILSVFQEGRLSYNTDKFLYYIKNIGRNEYAKKWDSYIGEDVEKSSEEVLDKYFDEDAEVWLEKKEINPDTTKRLFSKENNFGLDEKQNAKHYFRILERIVVRLRGEE